MYIERAAFSTIDRARSSFPITSHHVLGFGFGFYIWLFKQERLALSMHGVLGFCVFCLYVCGSSVLSIRFYFVGGLGLREGFVY